MKNQNNLNNTQVTQINPKVTHILEDLGHLKSYIKTKYADYREAGLQARISEGRVKQIMIGYHLPKSTKLIYQIADGWEIDVVKLTLLFNKVRQEAQ
jgi:hypothetical protein